MGKIVIISGPSGAGKTTICKHLEKDSQQVVRSISVTTRPPRQNEKNGEAYEFVSPSEFEKMIKNGELAEYARYCGHYYGTLLRTVEEALKKDCICLLEIDVQGALQIKQRFPQAISIFLLPPEKETLKRRLMQRNANGGQDMLLRLEAAEKELSYKDQYDYRVVNDKLEVTINTIRNILKVN
ncbi:MAG: guanylate kinase [Candidatus Brocadiaceae baterium WH-1]|nr:MAG: guanylate kinase [Candidatus Jettenia sp. AMX2]